MLARERRKTSSLLLVLDAMVMIEELDLPLKRNQTIILKYLPQYRDQLFVVGCKAVHETEAPAERERERERERKRDTDRQTERKRERECVYVCAS